MSFLPIISIIYAKDSNKQNNTILLDLLTTTHAAIATLSSQNKKQQPFLLANNNNTQNTTDSYSNTEKIYRLNTINAVSEIQNKEQKKYQSGSIINQSTIENNPSGNGDIGSLLRILPNVQFDNKQLQSTTPGEIDPARISISGGLHYQNLFMIDGMGMNNDLDPAGSGSWTGAAPGNSQGLAIDTSLLESIVVQDSNIGAMYGGFTGGVVEANIRRPKKKFGTKMSYQITQGNATPGQFSLTNYHIYGDNAEWQDFVNTWASADSEQKSPFFTKHIARINAESKINDFFGFIAAFTTTQSFIPVRRSDDDYKNPDYNEGIPSGVVQDLGTDRVTSKRQKYDALFKAFYDIGESVRTELTYMYIPSYNHRYLTGVKPGQSYSWDSGGHEAGLKTIWENDLGSLTNVLSYSALQNTTTLRGYEHTKYWVLSDSKNWSNWAGWAREGGYAPSISMQHTATNKIYQDFSNIDVLRTTHRFQLGAEIGYQYASFSYTHDYMLGRTTPIPMTAEQQKLCIGVALEWCDPTIAYDPRDFAGNAQSTWAYGQYFASVTHYESGRGIKLHNTILGLFFQDDIMIPLWKLGNLTVRPGIRLDYDTYMQKLTPGYRLAINYELPWNEWGNGRNFPTRITGGVNRYYGRNIFAYRLNDGRQSLATTIRRSGPEVTWNDVLTQGRTCAADIRERDPITNAWVYYHIDPASGLKVAGRDFDNCIIASQNSVKFNRLNVPYVDEYVIGIAQNVYEWSFGAKYIYREGKDDIRYVRSDYVNLPSDPNYASTYYTYTNEGRSWTYVVTLTLQNDKPIKFLGIENYFFFAFDWTHVTRNFTDYASSATQGEIDDELIRWNGQLIHWSQRPADNYVRPWTMRLSTTSAFTIWKIRGLWNNFFRYRAGYFATAYQNNVEVTLPDGSVQGIRDYRVMNLPGSFTWDMRIGMEIDVKGKNTLFINIDIYNILDTENIALASGSYATGALTPIYEVGRQFWFELGYKF